MYIESEQMCTLTSIALEPSSNMLEACRTCLRLIDVDNFSYYEIEADNLQLSEESCRYKLLSIVPEMELNIAPKSMICAECHGSLEALFEFKAKCLKTEDIIVKYLKSKPEVDVKNFDLKDVLAFNEGDIKDEAVKVSIQHVTVKEEERGISEEFVAVDESITIVKHEVENHSSESVETVHPENKVVKSKKKLKSGKYKCHVCSKSFVARDRLTRHVAIHTNERPYKCNVCSKGFNDKSSLNYHVQTHNKVRNYECNYCKKRFTNTKVLKRHLDTHEETKRSNESNQRFEQITSDTSNESKERPYECETCRKRFIRRNHLNEHQKLHGDKDFECKYCNKRFITSYRLNTHLLMHTGDKPHRCEICDKRFGVKRYLTFHMRTHTGEKPYECEKCGQNFARPSSLFEHRRTHSKVAVDESITIVKHELDNRSSESVETVHPENKVLKSKEKFECTICSKCFLFRSRLKTHMAIHTNERPYKCNVCSKGFNDRSSLNYHVQTHNKVRNYECDHCNKRFTNAKLLKKHLDRHDQSKCIGNQLKTKEKSHLCEICDKPFRLKQNLKVHMRTHTGEQLYERETCQMNFANPSILAEHQKLHSEVKDVDIHTIVNEQVEKSEPQEKEDICE